ncbi:hypothetical protein LRD69_10690 [Streptomyces sp. JH14]|uniref:hypothetical protein n=1 Tax=Streptomyces sp. JH14 TaxID=2793630 RepID=UPI0023F6F5F0|nr:hypothetical protein [Streptomyces sp. JH14]MDF6042619.1 hypothetical protein [Streptomyces sp. JH14]
MNKPVLEPAAQELTRATVNPPFPYELGPQGPGKVLGALQATPVEKPGVREKWVTAPAAAGWVPVRIVTTVDAGERATGRPPRPG